MENIVLKIDLICYEIISKLLIFELSTPMFKAITSLAGMVFLIILVCLFFVFIKNKKIALSIALNLLLSATLNFIVKNIIRRPRPTENRIIDEWGYSFPSGHSMVSMAFYGYLIYLVNKYVKDRKLKITLIILLSLLVLSIGVSRIYLGVHYTTDVLGGFLLAIFYLIFYIKYIEKKII